MLIILNFYKKYKFFYIYYIIPQIFIVIFRKQYMTTAQQEEYKLNYLIIFTKLFKKSGQHF